MPKPVPNELWVLWDKPPTRWPDAVRLCIGLWRDLNPDWTVNVVDGEQMSALLLEDFTPEVLESLAIQMKSDMLRLKLMRDRGGLWADATCLPILPLAHWIAPYRKVDFSAPRTRHNGQPIRNGRLLSSWFLVSAPGGKVATRWYDLLRSFFDIPRAQLPGTGPLGQHAAANWRRFVGPAARDLGVYPYFTMHYLMASEAERAPAFRDLALGNLLPEGRYYKLLGLLDGSRPPNDAELAEMKRFIREAREPINKLSWRRDNFPAEALRSAVMERAAASI